MWRTNMLNVAPKLSSKTLERIKMNRRFHRTTPNPCVVHRTAAVHINDEGGGGGVGALIRLNNQTCRGNKLKKKQCRPTFVFTYCTYPVRDYQTIKYRPKSKL